MEDKQDKYEIKRLIDVYRKLSLALGGFGVIDYIAITPNEFSIYINKGVSMVLVNELDKLKDVIHPDSVFFNESNPQLVIANTAMKDTKQSGDIEYLMKFIDDCAIFICPCTGSEIHLSEGEIRIFIDQEILPHSDYIGVYNLFDDNNLIFRTVFDVQRPYLSIMYWNEDGVLNG